MTIEHLKYGESELRCGVSAKYTSISKFSTTKKKHAKNLSNFCIDHTLTIIFGVDCVKFVIKINVSFLLFNCGYKPFVERGKEEKIGEGKRKKRKGMREGMVKRRGRRQK